MKKIMFFYLLLTVLFFTKCNKASDSDFKDTTPKQKLSNKDWKLLQSGLDTNGNGIAEPGELRYADSTTVRVNFHLNDTGTGSVSFSTPDTSGSANLTWTLDGTDTYVTSNIPAFGITTVSKIIQLTDMNFSVIADTSAHPYWFLYFTKQ